MSCILYSKASYTALGQNFLFDSFVKDSFRGKTGAEMAETIWKLNCEAFAHRYSDSDDDIRMASEDDHIDYEFKENLDNRYSTLWALLSRIDYQISDHPEYGERTNADLRAFETLQYRLARKMAAKLVLTEQPIISMPAHKYATLKREL